MRPFFPVIANNQKKWYTVTEDAENYYRIYDGQLLWSMTKYLLADNTNGAAVWSLKNLLRGY